MNAEIAAKLPQIEELCRRHGVVRLELFGSGTGPEFNPETSDFDFLAEFSDRRPGTRFARRFFQFEQELRSLFERDIDLYTSHLPIPNPYLARSINQSRRPIYEAQRARAAS
jgi:predicted nucleotidyltransferase